MTFEEAQAIVTATLAPRSLTKLQTDVFRGAWNQKSYLKISLELKHEYGYIKDIGAELWQMLTQTLGLKVTKLNLHEALAQYLQQRPPELEPSRRVEWGEAPEVSHFCGRQAQLATLEQWVRQEHCRLIAIVGQGGIGKTMLVTQLAQQLAETNQFERVVWRSLRQAPPLRDLLSELMHVLAPNQPLALQLDAAIRQLLEQLRHHRYLVILDNVEAVLASNELVGTYRPGYEDYGWLLQQLGQGRHQSSIVLTSRETPAEVAIYQGVSTPIRLLRLEGLSTKEGEIILASKGLRFSAENPYLEKFIHCYQGNPLALEIVATSLKDLFDGNIAAFLAQETLLFGDIRSLLTQQLNRLSSTERQVMDYLAINRRAMSAAQLLAHLKPLVSQGALLNALMSLDQRSLIEKIKPTLASNRTSYTQPPVVMEYITEMTEQTCQGVEGEIDRLRRYPLRKVQVKDHGQEVQKPLAKPALTKLRDVQGGQCQPDSTAAATSESSAIASPLATRVLCRNLINLLRQRGAILSNYDFTNHAWQADLQMVNLYGTNFTHADLSRPGFSQLMSDILCMCTAFNPDAQHIALSHDDGEVCEWPLEDRQRTGSFRVIASRSNSIVYSPDGKTLIVRHVDLVMLHIPSQILRGELHTTCWQHELVS